MFNHHIHIRNIVNNGESYLEIAEELIFKCTNTTVSCMLLNIDVLIRHKQFFNFSLYLRWYIGKSVVRY